MSENYLPLFRKYRPQSFCDLVGQESLVKALSNAIELNRVAHAYLFCGPRGTGKTSSARIFAKSLNCEQGPTLNPCQKCASCIDITNATGMDVIEIDAATNRGVEGAEDLIEQVHYAPINGKYKIFIIDEVHMLTSTAFNALLKTFEEPPENVIFILATTEPHKVLETIVSRCQRFDFRRITVEDITKRLREISDLENIKITDDALFTIAKNVSGGLRDSLALLDQVSILGAKEEITKEMIEELLGKVTFDKLLELLDFIVASDVEKAIALIDEIYTQGSEPRNLCENFLEFLRNVIVVINAKNPHDVTKFSSLSIVDIDKITNKRYDSKFCERILDTATEYYKEIKLSTNPYLWVELMIIRCLKSRKGISFEQIQITKNKEISKEKTAAPECKLINKPEQASENEVTKNKFNIEKPGENKNFKKNEPQQEDMGSVEIWNTIVNSIQNVPGKFFYSGVAKLVGVKENKIILGFINQNVVAQAKSDLKYKALIEGEKNAFGGKYSFEFVQLGENIKPIGNALIKPVAKTEPVKKIAAKEIYQPTIAKEQTKEDISNAIYSQKVKEMLEAFNGKIID